MSVYFAVKPPVSDNPFLLQTCGYADALHTCFTYIDPWNAEKLQPCFTVTSMPYYAAKHPLTDSHLLYQKKFDLNFRKFLI